VEVNSIWHAGLWLGRKVALLGFFGGYVFDGRTWHDFSPDSDHVPGVTAPWLSVLIYDSDIAVIRYEPAGPGSGTAYLGFTPRVYFGDESASAHTDVHREADGLAFWLAQQGQSCSAESRDRITTLLASDTRDEQPEDDDLGEADIFVEVKVSQFLEAAGLPLPEKLQGA
jgi:hypothetical protein